jgi:hypothetical protein
MDSTFSGPLNRFLTPVRKETFYIEFQRSTLRKERKPPLQSMTANHFGWPTLGHLGRF